MNGHLAIRHSLDDEVIEDVVAYSLRVRQAIME